MNIAGLDYNTHREKMILPEYGREIQKMVDHAVSIADRNERQRCAETIISIMERMFPQGRNDADHKQMLWDHLALMSGFKLDIDYPYDVAQALKIAQKPEPLTYPMTDIPIRHYGKILFRVFDKLKTMPAGEERDDLARRTANQMKRSLMQWSNGSAADEKVIADLSRLTNGAIQLDLNSFKFDKINIGDIKETRRKKK